MSESKNYLGAAIGQLRLESGTTQERIQEISGVGQSALSRIENGKQGMKTETLWLIAKAFNLPVSAVWERAEMLARGGLPVAKGAKAIAAEQDRIGAVEDRADAIDVIIPTLIRVLAARLPGAAAELQSALSAAEDEASRSPTLEAAIDAAEKVRIAEESAARRALPHASSSRPRRSNR